MSRPAAGSAAGFGTGGAGPTHVLGVSCFFHDAAASLLRDGAIVAAAAEERFTRKKHDDAFPERAIRYCLDEAGILPADLDVVAFYDKPFRKFDRILTGYLATFPRSRRPFTKAVPVWLETKLRLRDLFRERILYDGPVVFGDHHRSHAASAFFVSPFEEAAILTADAVGEWDTAAWGRGRGNRIELGRELRYPHSLGLLYSAFTYHLGFRVNSGEYKVMGLAPYGEPCRVDEVMELVDLREDGSFALDLDYFAYHRGLRMTSPRFEEHFGGPRREPDEPIERRHRDLAASLQAVTEEILLRMARHVHERTGLGDLCMAGGVALNSVANRRILDDGPFERLWVQPAAGDAGGALGAAAFAWHELLDRERGCPMEHVYRGPGWPDDELRRFLDNEGVPYRRLGREALVEATARRIAAGGVVGWFQGRMEFGPRALGNRSILGDPRDPEMKDRINAKIKFREPFRPFAPSVLEERAAEYFEVDGPSPFMLFVVPVREERRGELPAVTHVDGTSRIQTVAREQNPLFHALLSAFERTTGCPVLLNTSFNVRGEPIVRTPRDAWSCFLGSELDHLVLGDALVDRSEL